MKLNKIEYSSLEEQRKLQEKLLKKQLAFISKNSKYYKNLFAINRISLSKIRKIKDLSDLPFTTKEDLQKNNHDFFCVKKTKIIDYLTTSGTSGQPVLFGLTNSDLKRLEYNEYLSLTCAGFKKKDTVQIMTTLDRRFMAGLAYYLGSRKIGAGIIRAGAGSPEFQWDTIKLINPNTIITVPSFLLKLIEYAKENQIDFQNYKIKKAICIGDSIREDDFNLNELGKRINDNWDIKLYSTYASTEMATAFTECKYGCGGHHHPELIITEFLDEHDNPVNEGEQGELIITNLGIEGLPLLRYKTGDICSYYLDPCQCGRTTFRIGPVIGRKNQMIKYKGTTLYPVSLYNILDNFDFIENYIVVVSQNELKQDNIKIKINIKNQKEEHLYLIKERFKSKLRVIPEIEVISKEEIIKCLFPADSRKAMKFIDLRAK